MFWHCIVKAGIFEKLCLLYCVAPRVKFTCLHTADFRLWRSEFKSPAGRVYVSFFTPVSEQLLLLVISVPNLDKRLGSQYTLNLF